MSLFSAGTGMVGLHPTRETLVEKTYALVISDCIYGSLHQYLKEQKCLSEAEAVSMFRQVVELVRDVHSRGIALVDITLTKFVFEDKSRLDTAVGGGRV